MKEYLKNIAPNAEVSGLLWKVRNHYGCPGTSSAQQRPDRGVGRRPVRILRRRIRCPVPHPTVAGKSRFKARRNVHTPGHDLRAHPAGPGAMRSLWTTPTCGLATDRASQGTRFSAFRTFDEIKTKMRGRKRDFRRTPATGSPAWSTRPPFVR
jgi:hypothetical protein